MPFRQGLDRGDPAISLDSEHPDTGLTGGRGGRARSVPAGEGDWCRSGNTVCPGEDLLAPICAP